MPSASTTRTAGRLATRSGSAISTRSTSWATGTESGNSARNARIAAGSSSIEIAIAFTPGCFASSSSAGKPLPHGLHHDAQTSITSTEPRALWDDHVPPSSSGSVSAGSGVAASERAACCVLPQAAAAITIAMTA